MRSKKVLFAASRPPPPPPRLTLEQQRQQKEATKAALERAANKLEELNEVPGEAPKSWADLGLPPPPPPEPLINPLLSVAPLFLGAFSVGLFLLNQIGAFGDGSDIEALVEEWSKL